ncbi:MAG: mycofactocin-associated electron transfer flavoprotein alpha subunit [Acidimicrobiales bacterium]
MAVVVARDGRLPLGADEAVSEAGGSAVVVGSGAEMAACALVAADRVWWCETGAGLRPGALAAALAPELAFAPLVILPSSPDGRDLGPRLAAAMGRPLIAQAQSVAVAAAVSAGPDQPKGGQAVVAEVARLDDRLLVPVTVDGSAVATLVPGARAVAPATGGAVLTELTLPGAGPALPGAGTGSPGEPELLALVEPDPATMDLADATRVLGGGAGLVAGRSDEQARATFGLLTAVSAALGASAGATRVATDAGWIGHERQIGTTGVSIDPDLYIAFGISGASQHVGGLGTVRHVVSVNRDPSCPMTAMADLGLVTDAGGLLLELARRFGVAADDAMPADPAEAEAAEMDHA